MIASILQIWFWLFVGHVVAEIVTGSGFLEKHPRLARFYSPTLHAGVTAYATGYLVMGVADWVVNHFAHDLDEGKKRWVSLASKMILGIIAVIIA